MLVLYISWWVSLVCLSLGFLFLSFALVYRLWTPISHRTGLLVCQIGLYLTDGGMRIAQFGAGIVDRSDWLVSDHERGIPISDEK